MKFIGSARLTAGSISRQPPEPTTTVVVVWSYELVATSTPGAISVSLLTQPVYQQRALQVSRKDADE